MTHDIDIEDTEIASFNYSIDKLRKDGYKLISTNEVDTNLNSDNIKFRCTLRKKFENEAEYSFFIFLKRYKTTTS